MADPLILTALLDDEDFARFDDERRTHYPPSQNRVPAHLTLFHNLPGDALADIRATLEEACAAIGPLTMTVTGLRFLGRGCAYTIDCPALTHLQADLAGRWQEWLIPQDRQTFHPHIVIRNKAGAPEARALYERLQASFQPFTATATGLSLWHYRDGPWETAQTFLF